MKVFYVTSDMDNYEFLVSGALSMLIVAAINFVVVTIVLCMMLFVRFWKLPFEKLIFVNIIVAWLGRVSILFWWVSTTLSTDKAVFYSGMTFGFFMHWLNFLSYSVNAGILYVFYKYNFSKRYFKKVYFGIAILASILFISTLTIYLSYDTIICLRYIGMGPTSSDSKKLEHLHLALAINYAVPFAVAVMISLNARLNKTNLTGNIRLPERFKRMRTLYGWLSLTWCLFTLPHVGARIFGSGPFRLPVTFALVGCLPLADCVIILKYSLLAKILHRRTPVWSGNQKSTVVIARKKSTIGRRMTEDMTEDVTGDDVTGDDVTGDDVTGDDVTGDDVTGDDVTGDDVVTEAENQEREENRVSGNYQAIRMDVMDQTDSVPKFENKAEITMELEQKNKE